MIFLNGCLVGGSKRRLESCGVMLVNFSSRLYGRKEMEDCSQIRPLLPMFLSKMHNSLSLGVHYRVLFMIATLQDFSAIHQSCIMLGTKNGMTNVVLKWLGPPTPTGWGVVLPKCLGRMKKKNGREIAVKARSKLLSREEGSIEPGGSIALNTDWIIRIFSNPEFNGSETMTLLNLTMDR
uniref:Uncharacterized protein n=1 Tax=Cucumis melo TaxID=3656 RepID=A0A9I9CXV2_CUCME